MVRSTRLRNQPPLRQAPCPPADRSIRYGNPGQTGPLGLTPIDIARSSRESGEGPLLTELESISTFHSQAPMLAQLIPLDGGKPVPIQRDITVVGRSRDECDLYINRNSISKLHCVIVRTDGLLFVRDLGSTNGTKVNGQRILRGALLPGDQLAFANVKFKVHLGPDPVPPTLSEDTEFLSAVRAPAADEFVAPREHFEADPASESDVRLLEEGE